MKDKNEALEADLGKRLRELPDVPVDNAFKDSLRSRLLAEHANNLPEKRAKNFSFIRYGSVAAVLVMILAGWLAFFNAGKDSGAFAVGPLFMAQAQASNTAPQITLGSGLDGLRQVEFKMPGTIPAGPEDGFVFRLKNAEMTADQAMELARRIGISDAQLVEDGTAIPENRHIYITGRNADLTVWPYQGSWYYEERNGEVAGTGRLTDGEMQSIALKWLKAAGLMPQGEYTVEYQTREPRVGELILRLKAAPDGSQLIGCVPEIRVMVTGEGKVTQANGTWYADDQVIEMQFINYAGALEALKRGEGIFEANNYRHYQTGMATVDHVQTAYQLAYAIDYTPYLIPVAVFSGEYKPAGEPGDKFTALVPLIKNNIRPNSGNFTLNSQLPAVLSALPTVFERGVEVSRKELPQLAEFFHISGRPGEDGSIRDEKAEISPTSWDGGWLYRLNVQGQVRESSRIVEDKAIVIATELVRRIPVLPGVPGDPVVKDDGSGFSLVVFPLLYNGISVTSNEPPGYASYIAVQLGPRGDVWSVNCARPMRSDSGEKRLLTPEQAWEQLLANKSRIHVEGFFGAMPGDRFAAAFSSVTDVQLAYIPRHPELMRNDNYDLVYVFGGSARVGERQVGFTAYVNAVKG